MTARLVALMVLLAAVGTAAGAEFGRLFFTPEQRAALDNFRKLNVQSGAVVIEEDRDRDLVVPPSAPENVSVNGVVRRSDGRNTVWINNRAVAGREAGGIVVAPGKTDNRVNLTVQQSGRSFDLKVGQTAEILSGTIDEGYARRAVVKAEPEPAAKPAATSATTPQAAAPRPRRPLGLPESNEPAQPTQAEQGPAK